MKKEVSLAIEGRQQYQDQEPEIIQLVTDGTMEFRNGGWDISYEESELTGLAGVTTTFRVEPGIFPGWHMNKTHWLSVVLGGTVEDEKIKFMVDMSYELTKK